jgi:rhomboid protease GluP
MNDSTSTNTQQAEPRIPPVRVSVQMPRIKPVVTYTVLGFTILIFLLQMLSKFFYNNADFPAALGAKVNTYILAGEVWRLVTPVFFHGSILHLAFNMYALFILGRGIERFYGHLRFGMLYFIGAFAGNVASFILSSKTSLGASTAIFGLVAAEGIFVYQNRFLFGTQYRSVITNILMIVAVNLVLGLSPGIDNWGHLGGLAGGLVFAWFAGPRFSLEGLGLTVTLQDKRTTGQAITVFCIAVALIAGLAIIGFLRW